MHVCEKCGKEFSTKSNLNTHTRTVKNCESGNNNKYVCLICNYGSSNLSNFKRHQLACISATEKDKNKLSEELLVANTKIKFLENSLQKLEKQNERLVARLENVAIKGKSVVSNNNSNNTFNTILQLQPITQQVHDDAVGKITVDDFIQGFKGIVCKYMQSGISDKVRFTDISREIVTYLDAFGNIRRDSKGMNIAKELFESLKRRSDSPQIIEKSVDDLKDHIDMQYTARAPEEDLNITHELIMQLIALNSEIAGRESFYGDQFLHKFSEELLRHVTKV